MHLCAETSEVPFDTCFILSKSPCTPITVAHVLITPDFHFFIYLQTVITILSVSGLIFSTTEKQDWGKDAFRPLLLSEYHLLLAVLIPMVKKTKTLPMTRGSC